MKKYNGNKNIFFGIVLRFALGVLLCVCAVFPQSGAAKAEEFCFTVFARGKTYRFYYPQLHIVSGELALSDTEGIVNSIYLDTLLSPRDATMTFAPGGKDRFLFESEKDGECIDENDLKKRIEYALLAGKSAVYAKTVVLKPEVTVASLKKQTVLRASFSTSYCSSSVGRKHNVALAAKSVSGTVLMPGEIFSFNDTVGLRTAERGYKAAPVILDGEFTEGVGGGVCQVSTTLYNAALRAGLCVTESHRHSVAVGYVAPSFDAMVSDNACDLRFKNVTDRNVYIEVLADGNTLTANVYGLKRTREYRAVSVVNEIVRAAEKRVSKDSGLKPTKKKDGLKSSGYLYVLCGDKIERVVLLREDFYKPIDGVIVE